jgi:hypothetical protein
VVISAGRPLTVERDGGLADDAELRKAVSDSRAAYFDTGGRRSLAPRAASVRWTGIGSARAMRARGAEHAELQARVEIPARIASDLRIYATRTREATK